MTRKEKIYIALTILMMIIIFLFSAQDALESSEISDGAYDNVDNLLRSGLPELLADFIQDNFRKFAHFFLYSLLGFFSFGVVYEHAMDRIKLKLMAELSLCFCILYAMSDELHQRFVPGRACEWRDVCIDGLGAVLGIGLLALIRHYNRKK